MQKFSWILVVAILVSSCSNSDRPILDEILESGSDNFKTVLQNPAHEIQMIYGEIIGDSIVHHAYGVNETVFSIPPVP